MNVGQLAAVAECVRVTWFRACVCTAPALLLCHLCFQQTSSPTGFTLGTCNLFKRLCLCVYLRETDREKEREVPASLTKDSHMHSCWKMKLQVKAFNIYIFSCPCDRAVFIMFYFTVGVCENECDLWERSCTEDAAFRVLSLLLL